eukprot:gene10541-14163_t
MNSSKLKISKRKQVDSHKTQKNAKSRTLHSPLRHDLFSGRSILHYQNQHDTDCSVPYKHLVLSDLCTKDSIRSIHNELISHVKTNFKETDLFKLYQSEEVAVILNSSMSSLESSKKMPFLTSLRDSLYSKEFREFIQSVTKCDELIERVDCSINAYTNGCHLLCHDDVIGTRRVSFIIYLSDPDVEWTKEDGGAIELYPLDITNSFDEMPPTQGIPQSIPTKTILPTYNSMLIFTVQPGRSYHSVQEVFNKETPRLSISGWYHGTTPPIGSDKASLNQILSKGDDDRSFTLLEGNGEISSEDNSIVLSKKDMKFLKEWVNPLYLSNETIEDINEQFCENSSLQLKDFLKPSKVSKIIQAIIASDNKNDVGNSKPQLNYNVGITNKWKIVGPPHKRRYLLYPDDSDTVIENESIEDYCGQLLDQIRKSLFRTVPFMNYLQKITSLRPTGYKDEIRRFRAGLDYTVAHYGILTKIPRLDANLCFVNENSLLSDTINNMSQAESSITTQIEVVQHGDVGGFECYIEAEDSADNVEAAEVYRINPSSSLLSISAGCNVLSLVMRDENIMKFIKYVSANAPGSRWDISTEYQIEIEEDKSKS